MIPAMNEKVCLWCGERFQPVMGESYCSIRCFEDAMKEQHVEYPEAKLSRRRKTRKVRCARCGAVFMTGSGTAKYCNTCREAAYKEKAAEKNKRRYAERKAQRRAMNEFLRIHPGKHEGTE